MNEKIVLQNELFLQDTDNTREVIRQESTGNTSSDEIVLIPLSTRTTHVDLKICSDLVIQPKKKLPILVLRIHFNSLSKIALTFVKAIIHVMKTSKRTSCSEMRMFYFWPKGDKC